MRAILDNNYFTATADDENVIRVSFKEECANITAKNFEDIQRVATELAQSENGNADAFIFDLEKVTYVSSAGLRMFSTLNSICREDLDYSTYKLVNIEESVYKVFELTGYSSIFTIEKKNLYNS